MGSCVDNSRILTVLSQMATEGGLGEDISDIPAVGMAPEWMSEKALAIATYCVASGAYVIMGIHNPIGGSEFVSDYVGGRTADGGLESRVGGKLQFITDVEEIYDATVAHIDKKRTALGLPEYDPNKFGASGDARMNELLDLPIEDRIKAIYGAPEPA
jgi:carbon-monoxide dehydrogenase catalytic subunit